VPLEPLFLKLEQWRGYALAMPPFSAFFKSRGSSIQTRAHGHSSPIEPLWLEWAALGGLLLFAAWLLGVRGVWGLLLRSDPTGITFVIIVLFSCATLWCGARSRELQQQRRALQGGHAASNEVLPAAADASWAAEYWRALQQKSADADAPLDVLLEQTHGPHNTAWWVNGIQLKLGLLGKVIGFSILALNIGQMQNFDPAQSQELLKSLTTGLGVALLTTMVGLVGNILLGLQLTRLDRYADMLVADCQRLGLQRERQPIHSMQPTQPTPAVDAGP
jgi:MotA/TolQ/ExbB proton channel family